MDTTRVTILGGTKRKVTTRDRRGTTVDRYEVRWRAQLTDGSHRDFRQRFARAIEADQHISLLRAVNLPNSPWRLDDDGRPTDTPRPTTVPADERPASAAPETVWQALLTYRSATWRNSSANGRKLSAYILRAMARLTSTDAPPIPHETIAYIDKVAFRGEREPTDDALSGRSVRHALGSFDGHELVVGRHWLEQWSLPLHRLDRAVIRQLVADVGRGRQPSTEGRRFVQIRSIVNWWANEGFVPDGLTTRIGTIRGTVIQPLAEEDPIPTEAEMWTMAWALCLVGFARYAVLPLVMGGAGLRIGECFALRRHHCVDEPAGGMWLNVRGTYGTPGRDWSDSGHSGERRGTKAKGPDGDGRGRRTYLPPAEARVLRTHLEMFADTAPDALVFTSRQGKPVDISHLQERAWKNARELAFPAPHRLNAVGRHAFRHLAATRWLRAGIPLKTAAKWGGWKDIATMLRWYESRLPGDDHHAASLTRRAGTARPWLSAAD